MQERPDCLHPLHSSPIPPPWLGEQAQCHTVGCEREEGIKQKKRDLEAGEKVIAL